MVFLCRCRHQQLCEYFGDKKPQCGKQCDVCADSKRVTKDLDDIQKGDSTDLHPAWFLPCVTFTLLDLHPVWPAPCLTFTLSDLHPAWPLPCVTFTLRDLYPHGLLYPLWLLPCLIFTLWATTDSLTIILLASVITAICCFNGVIPPNRPISCSHMKPASFHWSHSWYLVR